MYGYQTPDMKILSVFLDANDCFEVIENDKPNVRNADHERVKKQLAF